MITVFTNHWTADVARAHLPLMHAYLTAVTGDAVLYLALVNAYLTPVTGDAVRAKAVVLTNATTLTRHALVEHSTVWAP